ncbi:MAG: hypothetical protein AAGK14_05730 [Verrucomicrobiota bacterium]
MIAFGQKCYRRIGTAVLLSILMPSLVLAQGGSAPPQPLTHARFEMKPEERREVAEYVIRQANWAELADGLRDVLFEAKAGPDFTGQGWSERLWLATLFQWLGTGEHEAAVGYLAPKLEGRLMREDGTLTKDEEIPDIVRQALKGGILERMLSGKTEYFFTTPEFLPRDQPLAKRLTPESLDLLLNEPRLIEELARTANPHGDYLPGVFLVLNDLITANPKAVREYPALAVALAVVYDQPLPPDWPHGQVDRRDVPLVKEPWKGLFAYFIRLQEEGELIHDLKELEGDRLKFLVDAPIELTELDWARENLKTSRRKFDGVYFEVRYVNERVTSQEYDWTMGPYTLANILSAGGICVDQAYFATIAGKAMGLPTLYFTGQGRDGGHAWIGYLRNKNRWETDIGRYALQKFVTGHAIDPQTWQPISDHALVELTRERPEGYRHRKSHKLLGLANLLGPDATLSERLALLDDAIASDPGNADVWQRKTELLQAHNATAYLITHLQDMERKFHTNEELSNLAQRQLAAIYEAQGETGRADRLRERLIKDLDRYRPDLAVNAAFDLLASRLKRGQYDEFFKEYRRQIRRFDELGGGTVFYHLIRPAALALQAQGRTQMALQCLEYAKERMTGPSDPTSLLAMDFATLESRLRQN